MPNVIEPCTVNFTRGNGLAVYQNAQWVVPVTVWTRTNLEDSPCDLTGYTGKMEVKERADYTENIFSPEVIIEENRFTLFLDSDKSKSIIIEGDDGKDTKMYVYTVDLTDPDGNTYRALQGNIEVSPSVIKDIISDDTETVEQ